jgi:hypothetical protein
LGDAVSAADLLAQGRKTIFNVSGTDGLMIAARGFVNRA